MPQKRRWLKTQMIKLQWIKNANNQKSQITKKRKLLKKTRKLC